MKLSNKSIFVLFMAFVYPCCTNATAQDVYQALKSRFRETHQATHDHLYRDRFVTLNIYGYQESGERYLKEQIEFRSNKTMFLIERLIVKTNEKHVTMLNGSQLSKILIKPTGEGVLTKAEPLPALDAADQQKIMWFTIDSSLSNVGIGFFIDGVDDKSIALLLLDEKSPKLIPPKYTVTINDVIQIKNNNHPDSYNIFSNGEYVLLKTFHSHKPVNKFIFHEENVFNEQWHPISKTVYYINDLDGKRHDLHYTEVLHWEVKEHDNSTFRLSRYGLPDFDDGELPAKPPYFLYAGVVFGIILCVALVRFFMRNHRNSNT